MTTPTFDQYVNLDKYHAPQLLGARARRRFHVMVKAAGSACNLDCTYCFYLSKQTLTGGPGGGHMDDEVIERFVRDYIVSVTGDEVVFSWQGGEPTLLGLDFFRKVVALQRKHAKAGQRFENDLQTNGTLLDENWARFLKEHRFLVGLSIDGPHDSRPLPGHQARCADVRHRVRRGEDAAMWAAKSLATWPRSCPTDCGAFVGSRSSALTTKPSSPAAASQRQAATVQGHQHAVGQLDDCVQRHLPRLRFAKYAIATALKPSTDSIVGSISPPSCLAYCAPPRSPRVAHRASFS
jgi:hypothetical protein